MEINKKNFALPFSKFKYKRSPKIVKQKTEFLPQARIL